MTHLRKMMLEELERRNYSERTIRYYLRFVERFALHFGKSPDKLGLRWLRLFGQVFRVFKWKNCSASRRGCGNVKIGFIDFQGLVGRAENSSIVFRAFHEIGISTACFIAR